MGRFYQATEKDLDDVYDLLVKYKREIVDLDLAPIDEDRLYKSISTIQKRNSLLCVRSDDDELIGTLGFVHSKHFWTEDVQINVLWCYVKKQFRSFEIFKKLTDLLKKIAKDKPIMFGYITKLELDNLMLKVGYEEMGKNWRYK